MTLAEYRKKKAEKFDKLVEECRYSPNSGQAIRESLEWNPDGYNVGQMIGLSMGNARMFSKEHSE